MRSWCPCSIPIRFYLLLIILSNSAECKCIRNEKSVECATIDDFATSNFTRTPELVINNCNGSISFNGKSFLFVTRITFNCPVNEWINDIDASFPHVHYIHLPKCNLRSLPWQAVITVYLQTIDLSNCPIECSCDNYWMYPVNKFDRIISPLSLSNCSNSCDNGVAVAEKTIITVREGESVRLNVAINDHFTNVSTFKRPYFKWANNFDEHEIVEHVFENNATLIINNATSLDSDYIYFICWHCVNFVHTRFQLAVIGRIVAKFARKKIYDTDHLEVNGYPLDNLTLKLTNSKNETEIKPLARNSTKFFGSLVFRKQPSMFFAHQVFDVFTVVRKNGDHLTGMVQLNICSQFGFCTLLEHNIEHFETKDSKENISRIPTNTTPAEISKHGPHLWDISTNLVFILLVSMIIFLILLFKYQMFFKRKLFEINLKMRQNLLRVPDAQPRRSSQETEETLLRLEERSSLSSSDYSNRVIPFIDIGNIKIHEQIGKGAFGHVYCGSWEKLGDRSVAIKTIKHADQDVEKEAVVLSRLDHPNIIRLYGMTRENDNLLLVFELMTLGDLRTYLRERAPNNTNYTQFPPALVENELKNIVKDVVSGVCYLTSQQIVHRDLAARNCLVSGESDLRTCQVQNRPPIIVKISDFGMSRKLYADNDYYRMAHNSLLPIRWLPPEAIGEHRFSHFSDIWSLGVTMWEVFSYGQIPFSELSNNEVVAYALQGVRPPKSKHCPSDVYSLMLQCWEIEPEKRILPEDILLDEALRTDNVFSVQNNNNSILNNR